MVRIRLDESQLNKLFEYHAQQRLPFKDSYGFKDYEFSEKNTVENYIDWIEEFGKVGRLGKSSIDFISGLKSGFGKAFDWYCEKYGVYVYVGDEKELSISATKRKFYERLGKEGFYVIKEGGYDIGPEFNEMGNMYVERVIVLDNALGDIVGDMIYHDLIDAYQDNVGGCWSWKKGCGMAYCERGNGTKVLLRGWIRLDDIDWVETVYINSYNMNSECEIRVKPNAKVELFDILGTYEYTNDFYYDEDKNEFAAYSEDGVSNKVYKFDLGGRHIIVNSTYFGNNGKYDKYGYAELYDAVSDERRYVDRRGNIYNLDGIIRKKLSTCNDENDLRFNFSSVQCFVGGRYYILCHSFLTDENTIFKYCICDLSDKSILHNTFYDSCDLLNGYCCKVGLNGKHNIIKSNGEYYFDKWYDNCYFWGGCCVIEDNGKYGIYKEGFELDLKYDDINRTFTCHSNSKEFIGDLFEVKYNGAYNLLDWYNDRIVSPIWFGEYQVHKYKGTTVVEFYDYDSDMYIFVDVLSGEIIDKINVLDL